MAGKWVVIAGALALAGCAARVDVATADRPLLSVETRLACAVETTPAEAATRGPHRRYDGEAMPSVPAPASAEAEVQGITPRRSCASGDRMAALMTAMPELTAAVDATGAIALVETEPRAGARAATAPPLRLASATPPAANRAADAAARLAQAATARLRPPR